MKYIIFFIAIYSLLVSTSSAEIEIKPITVHTTDVSNIGQKLNNNCLIKGSEYIDTGRDLYIIGTKLCKTDQNHQILYLLAIIDGKEKYISAKDVSIDDQDLLRLTNYSDDNLIKLKSKTINIIKEKEIIKAAEEAKERLAEDNKRKKEEQYIIDKLKKVSKYGVAIISYNVFDMSEYTEGTGFKVLYLNLSKKPIKYITAYVVGLNSVNDPVELFASRNATAKLKIVGPLKVGGTGGADYEYVWHTDIVQSAVIKKLLVEYMDGTKKDITNIKAITMNDAERSMLQAH